MNTFRKLLDGHWFTVGCTLGVLFVVFIAYLEITSSPKCDDETHLSNEWPI